MDKNIQIIFFDPWPVYSKVTEYQIFSTFFPAIFSVYLDCKRIWQFDSCGMPQDTKNELLQNILLLNGEINNKVALNRGSLKYNILDAIIVLGK